MKKNCIQNQNVRYATYLSIAIILTTVLITYILLGNGFPDKCPYGHSDLERRTQKVSYLGEPSIWTKIKINYITPPEEYLVCKECGWIILKNGEAYRESEDPGSFEPPIPEFLVFRFPKIRFTYQRSMLHESILHDCVDIDGNYTYKVEKYILEHLKKYGIKKFTETTFNGEPALQSMFNKLVIIITYIRNAGPVQRRFRNIILIYPKKK